MKYVGIVLALGVGLLSTTPVTAKPFAASAFCDIYPESPSCNTGQVDCTYCHTSAPTLNSFGSCVKNEVDGTLESDFANAINAVSNKDCDGDGATNLEEILAGKYPGNKNSRPKPKPKDPSQMSCAEKDALSEWNLCSYDALYTFKRIHIDFCGKSPSYTDYKNFKDLAPEGQLSALHTVLDDCMQTAHWRGKDGVVWRMGHAKIQPLRTIKSGEEQGSIPLGDYYDDYNLFVYHHLGDTDVRGLLTAQYHVRRDGLTYETVDNIPLVEGSRGVPGTIAELFDGNQQFTPQNKRAGMLTTLWFAVNNTMFTSVPRTTAAQALRSYLDIDIAKSEGLIPPDDPNFVLEDYDNKGITHPDCAFCHEVLDPAAYPFGKYNGLSFNVPGNDNVDVGSVFDPDNEDGLGLPGWIPDWLIDAFINRSKTLVPGMYKESRMEIIAELNEETEPDLANIPEGGFLLGQRVDTLLEWADVAVNSDEFAQATTKDYWQLFIEPEVTADHKDEFDALWQGLKNEDDYRVRAMLHRLIETEAYGAP